MQRLSLDEAVLALRADPAHADLVRDAYLGEDAVEIGPRFLASPEFAETLRVLGSAVTGAVVLDLGAGRGIASYAFARSGAAKVLALEPDPSPVLGRGSLQRLCAGLPVEVLDQSGESLDLPPGSVDLVYARQALHHVADLDAVLGRAAAALRAGGLLLAVREPVADTPAQLEEFLASHPVHRLAGGEHAWPLATYRRAIAGAGLELLEVWAPWDSLLNASPPLGERAELAHLARRRLSERLGTFGALLAGLPGVESAVRAWLNRSKGGRLYSFLARRPA